MTDYEYGVMFPPPHVNAWEIFWCPEQDLLFQMLRLGGSVPVRRPVGEVEVRGVAWQD